MTITELRALLPLTDECNRVDDTFASWLLSPAAQHDNARARRAERLRRKKFDRKDA